MQNTGVKKRKRIEVQIQRYDHRNSNRGVSEAEEQLADENDLRCSFNDEDEKRSQVSEIHTHEKEDQHQYKKIARKSAPNDYTAISKPSNIRVKFNESQSEDGHVQTPSLHQFRSKGRLISNRYNEKCGVMRKLTVGNIPYLYSDTNAEIPYEEEDAVRCCQTQEASHREDRVTYISRRETEIPYEEDEAVRYRQIQEASQLEGRKKYISRGVIKRPYEEEEAVRYRQTQEASQREESETNISRGVTERPNEEEEAVRCHTTQGASQQEHKETISRRVSEISFDEEEAGRCHQTQEACQREDKETYISRGVTDISYGEEEAVSYHQTQEASQREHG